MGRYTLCPFYQWEHKYRITCEDTYRSFDTQEEKNQWMDDFCDKDWAKCPYAIEISDAYLEYEKGDREALEKQKKQAIEKEIKGYAMRLGRANKKIERLQKKVDELTAINQSFARNAESNEAKKREFYGRWREAKTELEKRDDKVFDEINKLTMIYEQRLCYLIDTYLPEGLREQSVVEWAKSHDKAFALTHEYDEKEGLVWKVVFEDEAIKNEPGRIQGTDGDAEAGQETEVS